MTNAMVGCAVAMLATTRGVPSAVPGTGADPSIPAAVAAATGPTGLLGGASVAWSVVVLAVSIALMYAGGMVLNDRLDLEIDRRERPHRPIPSGRISPGAALNAAIVLMGAGAIGICAVDRAALPWALALVGTIVAYDLLHARAILGIPLMALCRALAMVVPAAALGGDAGVPWRLLAWFALPLALYVAIMSIVARGEARADGGGALRRWLGPLLLVPALAPVAALGSGLLPALSEERAFGVAFLMGALIAWIVRAQLFATPLPPSVAARFLPSRVKPGGVRVPRAIMAWIGAIALVDAMSLALLAQPGLALVALGLFFVVTVGHSRIAGS